MASTNVLLVALALEMDHFLTMHNRQIPETSTQRRVCARWGSLRLRCRESAEPTRSLGFPGIPPHAPDRPPSYVKGVS